MKKKCRLPSIKIISYYHHFGNMHHDDDDDDDDDDVGDGDMKFYMCILLSNTRSIKYRNSHF